jgi:endo-1,4-beta-xylanase
MKKYFSYFMVLMALLAACKKNNGGNNTPPVAEDTIRLQSVAPFKAGVAVGGVLLNNISSYRNIILKEYNAITAETAGQFGIIHPLETVYDFAPMDLLVGFSQANNKPMHVSSLIWHVYEQAAPWVQAYEGDSAALENVMKSHIQTIVARFKGKVKSWDVVNEAYEGDGTLRNSNTAPVGQSPNGSIWRRTLGPDFIARAFQYAHAADPDALLFYNDYDLESGNPTKLNAVVAMANSLKARGIPIHGIGSQSHIGINVPNAAITNCYQKLASTGLLVRVSELDVLVSNFINNPSLQYTEALQTEQSEKYKFVAQAYKQQVPPAQRHGITVWGVGDADSWIPSFFNVKDWPLPFDKEYKRKKAYYGFRDGLKN